jgi:sugar lactone lactonase YvrE
MKKGAGLSPPMPGVEFGDQDGLADGSCVDATGTIWVAIWGGSRLERYSPDGQPVLAAELDPGHRRRQARALLHL